MISLTCRILFFFLLATGSLHADDARNAERHFETHVRPLLLEKCGECHGDQDEKGGLRITSRESLLIGGDSGPAIVAGAPDQSLLIEAVHYASFEMPPNGRLADQEIQHLTEWIRNGAPWPGGASDAPPPRMQDKITDEDRAYWAFQPLSFPTPPGDATDWPRNDIDRFIWNELKSQQLHPAPEASPLALIRRVTFDLTGLPPTPEQIDQFLSHPSPDAYEQLVDSLLESPRFGERWASFWLDLVRYGESDGFRKDDYRPEAWRYRDYVINAFNSDLPFSEFILHQLAGDEIAPHDPNILAATGFLRHGIYEYNQRDARQQRQDMLNDITDTVGDVFLGMGLGCARCHDHKFDPILQADYYRLQAFFMNVSFRDDIPLVTPEQHADHEMSLQRWKEATAEIRARIDAIEQPKLATLAQEAIGKFPEDIQAMMHKPGDERTSAERQLAYLVQLQVIELQQQLGSRLSKEEKEEWTQLKEQLKAFDDIKPAPIPLGRVATDMPSLPPPTFVIGKPRLGEVKPGFLTVLDPEPTLIQAIPASRHSSGRRLTLANWLSRKDHPLVSRVIVNRIWQEHFGAGLVKSASDFGALGERPSHPELLDWLASQLGRHGSRLKWLHREIVTSATYRQASLVDDSLSLQIDPENRLLWRAPIRRLQAEQIHDAMLQASGELELDGGGPSQPAEKSRRRSVYHQVLRNNPDPLLNAFDFPERMLSAGDRTSTSTPTQALLLMNGVWTIRRAAGLANRVRTDNPESLDSQARQAYRLALGRPPTQAELERVASFAATGESPDPLADFCHVLLNSNEFFYLE